MKYLQSTLILFCSVTLLLIGCKKNTTDEKFINTPVVQTNIKTKISSAAVSNWLQAKIKPSSPLKNNYINKILDNVQYDKMYVEQLHTSENLIVIPLKNEYFSQHIKQQKNKPIQYLLLVENAEGKIRRGDLVLFFPENATLQKLPVNYFHQFFMEEDLSVNGTFTLVTLGDVKQYEVVFKNGKKDNFKLWRSEINTASNAGNNANTSPTQNCTDWYLVTTYYLDGIPVYSTSEYVGTTCSGGGCPPDTECLEPEGTGGGGNLEVPVSVTRMVSYSVARELTSYENWEIKPTFEISGQTFTNASNNYFTGITKIGTAAGTSACCYYDFVASSQWPLSSRYSIYSEISHQCSYQNTTATASLICKMYYPNWPASWNPPGQGPSKTQFYSKGHTWQASTALY
jgi:hypothetical protein